MPGFGKTNNNYILKTQDYANIIKLFLEQININNENIYIVGHSFGGKVATLLKPSNLILLSSAGIIEKKSIKTLLTIRMAKIFNKFGLGKVTKLLRSSDVNMMNEVMYETFKNVVDEDFSNNFKQYKGKTQIFWGKNDLATTLSSGQMIHSLIKNSKLTIFNGDHYFFLKYANTIAKEIEFNNQ
jgi:pimeloyl-ACP methyl ester carboxylesterase